ncbi:MAG: type VI secretion system contractile sheath large subunit [Nannocystaceae bacterium]
MAERRSGRGRRGSEAEDRVSIVYRATDHSDALELPLKILVLGDFSSTAVDPVLDARRPVVVDQGNFNEVLAKQQVVLDFDVSDKLSGGSHEMLRVKLRLDGLGDLSPAGLVAGIPQLTTCYEERSRLLAAREIFACAPFREMLRGVWADPNSRAHLRLEVGLGGGDERSDDTRHESVEGPWLDRLVRASAAITGEEARVRELVEALVRALFSTDVTDDVEVGCVELVVAEYGERISSQIDEILHHPRFQQVEALWRSLRYLVGEVDTRENTLVELLSVSKQQLLDDFADAPELPQSGLYRIVYSTEYGTFGGKPFGLICACYEFGPSAPDLALLRHCAGVAAVSHAPFVANASPSFFGETSCARLPVLELRHMFEGEQYRRWRAFRETEDARYVGLCLPRFLLRKPYIAETSGLRFMAYSERVDAGAQRCLWGPSSIILAVRVAQAFAKYRWCVNIVGDADVGGSMRVLMPQRPALGPVGISIPVEVLLSERQEYELSEQGFIPLVGRRAAADACLFSANSTRAHGVFATTPQGRLDELNDRLGTQFPYLFIVTRLAHYVKVIQREPLGSIKDPRELERELNAWIRQYVADMETVSASVRSRKPLRQASVTVEEVPGRHDWLRCRVKVRPHFRYMGAAFTLDIGSKLDKGSAA